MIGTPVTSGYPGTPGMLLVLGFSVFLIVRSTLRTREMIREEDTGGQSFRNGILLRRVGIILLITALATILGHYYFEVPR
jgi:hypothetical protein